MDRVRNPAGLLRVLGLKTWSEPMTKHIQPVPEENRSPNGPGSTPQVAIDTTKGHRDDEKRNIDEQGDHANLKQNTSHRRSG